MQRVSVFQLDVNIVELLAAEETVVFLKSVESREKSEYWIYFHAHKLGFS